MKKIFYYLFVVFLFLVESQLIAQSIVFTSPTNGQTITSVDYGSTANSVPVNFRFNYTITPYPPLIHAATGIRLITNDATYDSREGDIPQWFYLSSNTYT